MTGELLRAIGGIGLFLLGMLVMTEGLRAFAGTVLRRVLARFTRTPWMGAATGAATTALIQSSSATIVIAIGFVGAGLMTFPQALGVTFGATVGTTVTGWLVALIGFRFDLGEAVLPLVLLGVALRVFGRGRVAHLGWALAGFSLLFLGIDAMQAGFGAFEGQVTPADFPAPTLLGRGQLVLAGVAITLVTQSSSAGVATMLVALGAGAVSFPQAAALVIGMDVGTAATALLATLGGSTATRRTGYANVVYKLLVGSLAFVLLVPYADLMDPLLVAGDPGAAQIAIVAFHTGFNLVGMAIALPLAGSFARLIARLVPERDPPLTRRLDDRLLSDADSATLALAGTVEAIDRAMRADLRRRLPGGPYGRHDDAPFEDAIRAAASYAEQIRTRTDQPAIRARHLAAMHALDHLTRLDHRMRQGERIAVLCDDPRLERLARLLCRALAPLPNGAPVRLARTRFNRLRRLLRDERHHFRNATVRSIPDRELGAREALGRMDAVRWLHRVCYHLWRIEYHRLNAAGCGTRASDVDDAAPAFADDADLADEAD